ncbi:MAG: response regulator transcription factor [Anaerolineaceae bacterium]|nr:response regulator transcription factor [Anaerolineaceae bacterium]
MNTEKTIQVLITDDHAVVRNGLSSFLMAYDDLELVGEAKNGEQAVLLCDQIQPDIVLMDLVMPTMDGATAIGLIKQKHPEIQVLALTSYKELKLVQSALKAGAIGYLLKDISAPDLAAAIRSAFVGKPTLAPEAVEALIHASQESDNLLGNDLTEREREVLTLMVEGLNNKQISERLFVSQSTAKSHVSNVLTKLNVNSRTEAVSFALKNKLV